MPRALARQPNVTPTEEGAGLRRPRCLVPWHDSRMSPRRRRGLDCGGSDASCLGMTPNVTPTEEGAGLRRPRCLVPRHDSRMSPRRRRGLDCGGPDASCPGTTAECHPDAEGGWTAAAQMPRASARQPNVTPTQKGAGLRRPRCLVPRHDSRMSPRRRRGLDCGGPDASCPGTTAECHPDGGGGWTAAAQMPRALARQPNVTPTEEGAGLRRPRCLVPRHDSRMSPRRRRGLDCGGSDASCPGTTAECHPDAEGVEIASSAGVIAPAPRPRNDGVT